MKRDESFRRISSGCYFYIFYICAVNGYVCMESRNTAHSTPRRHYVFAYAREEKAILSDMGFYLPLFLLVAVTNPLFSHNGVTPLFFMNGNPVTLEAVVYGVFISVMVVGVLFWCKCYNEIMTEDKFLYLFGRIIPKMSLVLSMALRFVPMFKRQMKNVSRAQKAMGLYSQKSYVDRLRGGIRVFTAMISWSLENSMELSSSMRARGYGLHGRTNFSLFKFGARDAAVLLRDYCFLLPYS